MPAIATTVEIMINRGVKTTKGQKEILFSLLSQFRTERMNWRREMARCKECAPGQLCPKHRAMKLEIDTRESEAEQYFGIVFEY